MAENELTTTSQAGAATVVHDDSDYAMLFDSARFAQAYRVAKLFSATQMVPAHYQGKPEDCFVAILAASRLDLDPLMYMQNTCVIHGRPGMEAKLVIALINSSGLFRDPLDYEVVGEDPKKPDYRVRAFAVRKSTGKTVYGPWVTWEMVKAEGWDSKTGSKWKTIPALMFMYRAAAFFGRTSCPERLMGMQTVEELHDVAPFVPATSNAATLIDRFSAATGEIPMTAEERQEVAFATCDTCGGLLIEGACHNVNCAKAQPPEDGQGSLL